MRIDLILTDLHVWIAVGNVFSAWRTEAAWHGGGQIDSQPRGSARILALSTATEHASKRASFYDA